MSDYLVQTPVALDAGVSRLVGLLSTRLVSLPRLSHAADPCVPLLEEDLAQLRLVLSGLGLTAGYRPAGETEVRVISPVPSAAVGAPMSCDGPLELDVPLHRSSAQPCGVLGLLPHPALKNDALRTVLKLVLTLTASALSERWFRLHHRHGWIVAAAPLGNMDQGLLLVLDQQLALIGLDFNATQRLGAGASASAEPQWRDFFRPIAPSPSLRARTDVPLQLTARDGAVWSAVLSPPDGRLGGRWTSEALMHARPRLPGLSGRFPQEPDSSQIPSLTPGMRRRVEEFVEAHLDATLSVERIAQAAGMSCSHFTRAFRNVLNMTPHRYVMWRRLVRAQELIRRTDDSLAEIALSTGFSDQSHLCRLFHQHMGESPSRYRRRLR